MHREVIVVFMNKNTGLQGDPKSVVVLSLPPPPYGLQTIIDTPNCVLEDRVQYSTVHIPKVFCDGHFQFISCVGDCSNTLSQVYTDFLITLYKTHNYTV